MARQKTTPKHRKKGQEKSKHSYELFFTSCGSADQENDLSAIRDSFGQEDADRIRPWEPGSRPESSSPAWVVLLRDPGLIPTINPKAFLNLALAKDSREKKYYSCLFRDKQLSGRDALIIPADAMNYLATLLPGKELSLDSARSLLARMNFQKEEFVLQQKPLPEEKSTFAGKLLKRTRLALAWPGTLALKELRSPWLRSLSFSGEHPLYRMAFTLFAVLSFVILPILSLDAGLSGDDSKHYDHAAKVHRYFTEDDPSALDDPKYKLNFYGQSFDYFTYLLIKLFGLEDKPYEARHFMVALTGAAAILVTGLFARLLAGYRAGLLALILMFFSPRFLGHAFNNPMDVPFLLGNVFTLYQLALFLKKLPRITIKHAILIALGLGWTIGIRIGGLLLVPYIFMFSGLWLMVRRWEWPRFSKRWWIFAGKGILSLAIISLAGYLLSVLTWPYALQDIVNHPIKSFKVMTNIQVSLRVLYDSALHWSDKLPWDYIPRNILMTVPALVLAGMFLSLPAAWLERKKGMGFWYFMFWFTILFPLVFIIFRESNVYGGWRHMMFIYPSIIILAALALDLLGRHSIKWGRWGRFLLPVLLAAGLVHPLRHLVLNHPLSYIYFNELSGGINKTYGHFETDYYGVSLKPATDYFLEEVLPGIKGTDELKVISNSSIGYYTRKHRERIKPSYSAYYRLGRNDWDYAILYCNYIHPYQLLNGLWPPKNTIHEIKVDSVTVAAIVKRETKDDYIGLQIFKEAMAERNNEKLVLSVRHLERAVAADKNNVAALLNLGDAYATQLRIAEAKALAEYILKIYPDYFKAYKLIGHATMVEYTTTRKPGLLDEAIGWFNKSVRSNIKFSDGYYNLGRCYAQKQDYNNAVYNLKESIRYNSKFIEAYRLLAAVYDKMGDTESARRVRQQIGE